MRCPHQAVAGSGRFDLADHDVGIAELGTAHENLQPINQYIVASPVLSERSPVPRCPRRSQISDDVAAAERVDRLLGIPDQDQRRSTAKGTVEHLPLHRVGVLELVDHHHRPALMHAGPGR